MRWLPLATYSCPKNVDVFVCWFNQSGKQVTRVAQWNGRSWQAHGRQIAEPTHFARIPELPKPAPW